VSGLCEPGARTRLQWAEQCGDLALVLADLSQEKEVRQARWLRLRGRLVPAWSLFAVAWLLAFALAAFTGQCDVDVPALLASTVWVASIHLFLRRAILSDGLAIARAIRRWRCDRLGGITVLHGSRTWVAIMVRGVRAGLTPVEVASFLVTLYPDQPWQRSARRLKTLLARGSSLTGALQACGWPLPAGLRAALVSGEQAGCLDTSLTHWLRLGGHDVATWLDTLEARLPWAFYIAVLLVLPALSTVAR
jgi:hypothetical protein